MNCEATKLATARGEEVAALGGLAAYRLQALQNLRLKTVVKESHATPVQALAFNHCDPQMGNLFATVGKDQATVYDDEHMGDHVALVVHFTNAPSEHAPGGQLGAAAWLGAQGWSQHPHGDACLAVAGEDPNISVISVAEARVTKLLRGHSSEVVELSAAEAAAPRLLASLSRDGNLRLWDVPAEACLSSLQLPDAGCMAMAPDGRSLLVGTRKGQLVKYKIVPAAAAAAGAAAGADGQQTTAAEQPPERHQQTAAPPPAAQQQQQQAAAAAAVHIDEGSRRELALQGGASLSNSIDCVRFLPGGRVATKSSDGCMCIWHLSSGSSQGSQGSSAAALEAVAAWRVPHCSGGGGWANRCQFGTTRDGRYIAVGNSRGDCYVFDAESGERVCHMPAVRISAPVRAYEYHGALAVQQQGGEDGGGGSEEEGKENAGMQ
ncbi:hypothetical protein COHA_007183 [Chlorella ohadii]|uniref:Uncharacterized protein n=1 Tax=Chlorella ohadii TaxID=2649997 RepID=A0AAD5DMT8_9CHLO|nr:hypothetical protein COHA_007183 [Chlorella ohadii]